VAPKKASKPTPSEPEQPSPSPPNTAHDLGPVPTAEQLNTALRRRSSTTAETYAAYGATEALIEECASQAAYTMSEQGPSDASSASPEQGQAARSGCWWYAADGGALPPTFAAWAHVSFLHMWIVLARLRLLPAAAAPLWVQHLTDHFFARAERNMDVLHGITVARVRAKYLKDLFEQWRGVTAAYDEGLVKGDAVLAAAVWRNVFSGAEDVDPVALAMVVSYLRREVARVGRLPEHVIASGRIGFGSPADEKSTVLMESRLMKEPFAEPS